MKEIDCDSIRRYEANDANFSQLTKVIEDAQANINLYVAQQGDSDISVQIIGKLEPSLQNLHRLLALLFEKTVSTLNREQLEFLIECNLVIAKFYCAVQFFIQKGNELLEEWQAKDPFIQANRLDYLFYYEAYFGLRTTYYNLKFHTHISEAEPKTGEIHDYLNRLLSSPFIPENREILDELGYWTDRLGEFMDEATKNSGKWLSNE